MKGGETQRGILVIQIRIFQNIVILIFGRACISILEGKINIKRHQPTALKFNYGADLKRGNTKFTFNIAVDVRIIRLIYQSECESEKLNTIPKAMTVDKCRQHQFELDLATETSKP